MEENNSSIIDVLTGYSKQLGIKIDDPNLQGAAEKFAKEFLTKSYEGMGIDIDSLESQMKRLERYNLQSTKNYRDLEEKLRLYNENREDYAEQERRVAFVKEILELNPGAIFISFEDFGFLYNSGGIVRSKDFDGYLTDKQVEFFIDLMDRIEQYSKSHHTLNQVLSTVGDGYKGGGAESVLSNLIQLKEIYKLDELSAMPVYTEVKSVPRNWLNRIYTIGVGYHYSQFNCQLLARSDYFLYNRLFDKAYLLTSPESNIRRSDGSDNYWYSFEYIKETEILMLEEKGATVLFQTFKDGIIIHGIFRNE